MIDTPVQNSIDSVMSSCAYACAGCSHFPHVCVPEPHGLPPAVLLGICRALVDAYGKERIVGLSVRTRDGVYT
jgi:hypothetical protein